MDPGCRPRRISPAHRPGRCSHRCGPQRGVDGLTRPVIAPVGWCLCLWPRLSASLGGSCRRLCLRGRQGGIGGCSRADDRCLYVARIRTSHRARRGGSRPGPGPARHREIGARDRGPRRHRADGAGHPGRGRRGDIRRSQDRGRWGGRAGILGVRPCCGRHPLCGLRGLCPDHGAGRGGAGSGQDDPARHGDEFCCRHRRVRRTGIRCPPRGECRSDVVGCAIGEHGEGTGLTRTRDCRAHRRGDSRGWCASVAHRRYRSHPVCHGPWR